MNKLKDLLNKSKSVVKGYTFDPNYKLPINPITGAEDSVFSDRVFSEMFNKRFDDPSINTSDPYISQFRDVSSHVMDEMHHQAKEFNEKVFDPGYQKAREDLFREEERQNRTIGPEEWDDRMRNAVETMIELDNNKTFIDDIGRHKDRVFQTDPRGQFVVLGSKEGYNDESRSEFSKHILRGLKDSKTGEWLDYSPLYDPYVKKMQKRQDAIDGIEQVRMKRLSSTPEYREGIFDPSTGTITDVTNIFGPSPIADKIPEKIIDHLKMADRGMADPNKVLMFVGSGTPDNPLAAFEHMEDGSLTMIPGHVHRLERFSRFPERYNISDAENVISPTYAGLNVSYRPEFSQAFTDKPKHPSTKREKLTEGIEFARENGMIALHELEHVLGSTEKDNFFGGSSIQETKPEESVFSYDPRTGTYDPRTRVKGRMSGVAQRIREMLKNGSMEVIGTNNSTVTRTNPFFNIGKKILERVIYDDGFRDEVIDSSFSRDLTELDSTFPTLGRKMRTSEEEKLQEEMAKDPSIKRSAPVYDPEEDVSKIDEVYGKTIPIPTRIIDFLRRHIPYSDK